jgi:competence protein ComEA
MFSLTHQERKVLIFIAILIFCGVALKFFNVKIKSKAENISFKSSHAITFPININKASQTELEKIPGIGPVIARRINEYRSQNGEFKVLEDLRKVKGIGDKKFQLIKDYISF